MSNIFKLRIIVSFKVFNIFDISKARIRLGYFIKFLLINLLVNFALITKEDVGLYALYLGATKP